ncbi:unnamed protein product, partial [Polarella glacialis]
LSTGCRAEVEQGSKIAADLRRVIDTACVPIFGVDVGGCINEWNSAAVSTFGWSREETAGRLLVETVITDSYQQEAAKILERSLQGRETTNFEMPFFTKSGWRWELLLSATPRRGDAGEVIGTIFVAQNITELRKELRKVLADQQQGAGDLTCLIETADAPIFSVDVNGCIVHWNEKTAAILGWAKEVAFGCNLVQEFVTDDCQGKVNAAWEQVALGQHVSGLEFSLKAQGGQLVRVLANPVARRSASGQIVGVLCIGQEITCRAQASAEAEELARVIYTANALIFGVDTEGCITEWNRKLAELSGQEKEEIYGKPFVANFVPEAEREEVSRVLAEALANNSNSSSSNNNSNNSSNYEFTLCTRDQQFRKILLSATARRSATGEVTGVIGVGQDITELYHQRLEAAIMTDDLWRLIDTANAAIFAVDREGKVTFWNQKVAELAGHPYEAVIGKPLVENFISEEYREEVAGVLEDVLSGESVHNVEIVLFSHDGERTKVAMNFMPRLGSDGCICGVISVGWSQHHLQQLVTTSPSCAESPSSTRGRQRTWLVCSAVQELPSLAWTSTACSWSGTTKSRRSLAGRSRRC